MKYVMADLHGFRDTFLRMLEQINLGKQDTLYVLGDAIDRGPHPVDLLCLIKRQPNIRFILGNHEDMLLKYLQDGNLERWMRNGGRVTLDQWERLPAAERLDLADFLASAPLYERVDEFLLVHSGLIVPPESPSLSFAEIMALQERNHLLWSREEFYGRPALPGLTVIFGHTATARIRQSRGLDVPSRFTIWHDELYRDKTGIDCGSYQPAGGRLGCLCLDNLQEYYQDHETGLVHG